MEAEVGSGRYHPPGVGKSTGTTKPYSGGTGVQEMTQGKITRPSSNSKCKGQATLQTNLDSGRILQHKAVSDSRKCKEKENVH